MTSIELYESQATVIPLLVSGYCTFCAVKLTVSQRQSIPKTAIVGLVIGSIIWTAIAGLGLAFFLYSIRNWASTKLSIISASILGGIVGVILALLVRSTSDSARAVPDKPSLFSSKTFKFI